MMMHIGVDSTAEAMTFPMDGNGIYAVPLSLFLLAKIPCSYDSQYTPISRVFNDLLAKIPCP